MGNPQDKISPLLSVPETASYLQMSESWVYQSLPKFCPACKIGGRVKYSKKDLDLYLERCKVFHSETRVYGSLAAIEVRNGKTLLHTK